MILFALPEISVEMTNSGELTCVRLEVGDSAVDEGLEATDDGTTKRHICVQSSRKGIGFAN